MKSCSKCRLDKEYVDFTKSKRNKDGYAYICKACRKNYRDTNRLKIKLKKKKYYTENKDRLKVSMKTYKENNKNKIKEYYKKYYIENKKDITKYKKSYRNQNKDKINKYLKNKRDNDILFRLSHNYRSRICKIFRIKRLKKSKNTIKLLNCNYETFKNHIESLFTEGMTWENYGEWHVDHKIPLASAENQNELEKLCNYKNTQPLWAEDNLSKNNFYKKLHILIISVIFDK